MFDFSFSEIILASLVALIVLGPERLPKVARKLGQWIGKAKNLSTQFQNELSRQAELSELQKMKDELSQTAQNLREEMQTIQHIAAWDRLPEQRTPADFGRDEHGRPLINTPPSPSFLTPSLRKQAMNRKRQARPRPQTRPQLRSRK